MSTAHLALQDLPLRNNGTVMLDVGGLRRAASIGPNGEALFPEIPANFRGQDIPVLLDATGYELADPHAKIHLVGGSAYIEVRRKSGRISGYVHDNQSKPLAQANVSVGQLTTSTNAVGYFVLDVPGEQLQDSLSLLVTAAGFETWRGTVVPNSNEISIPLPRSAAKVKDLAVPVVGADGHYLPTVRVNPNFDVVAIKITQILKSNFVDCCFCRHESLREKGSNSKGKVDFGREIFLLGYPVGIYEEKKTSPTLRQGIIATDPEENFSAKNELQHEFGLPLTIPGFLDRQQMFFRFQRQNGDLATSPFHSASRVDC